MDFICRQISISSDCFLIFYGSDGTRHENNHPSVRQFIVMARFNYPFFTIFLVITLSFVTNLTMKI